MKLALAIVPQSDFDHIVGHMLSYKPPYRNMHLRVACQRKKKRDLRYLHAMYVNAGLSRPEIEGMISGPGVFWHYKLIRTAKRTQLNVLVERGSSKELERIGDRFLQEIHARIVQDQAATTHHPVRTRGQFYLRRWHPGSPASHRNCLRAVNAGVLDSAFVSKLAAWDLELLCP